MDDNPSAPYHSFSVKFRPDGETTVGESLRLIVAALEEQLIANGLNEKKGKKLPPLNKRRQ